MKIYHIKALPYCAEAKIDTRGYKMYKDRLTDYKWSCVVKEAPHYAKQLIKEAKKHWAIVSIKEIKRKIK